MIIDKTKLPPRWHDCSGRNPQFHRRACYTTPEQAWKMVEEEAEPFTTPLKVRITQLEAELKIALENCEDYYNLLKEQELKHQVLHAEIAERDAEIFAISRDPSQKNP